jgi:tRNA threonylcarbamoyladenosine biosynthesis protein TsaE
MSDILVKNTDELKEAAKAFLSKIDNYKVVAFYGSMGAGKTSFIKAVCEELKVNSVVTSPTFTIVNEYSNKKGSLVYHFDFYRINKIEEIFDFGYEEYFYSGNYCFIEWPEIAEAILPENTLKVKIAEQKDGTRIISVQN